MNIALEQTEEYVNGQLKNKYGDAFIRGNNGNILSLHSRATSNGAFCLFVYNQDPQQIFSIIQKFSFSFALFIFNVCNLRSSL